MDQKNIFNSRGGKTFINLLVLSFSILLLSSTAFSLNIGNSSVKGVVINIPGTNSIASYGSFNATYNGSLIWAYNQTTPFTAWLNSFNYNYNQTITQSTYNQTYHGLNISYNKWWYNYTGTGIYYYNQTTEYTNNWTGNGTAIWAKTGIKQIGIGTVTPNAQLELNQTVKIGALKISGVSFYDGVSYGGSGTQLLNYYDATGNKQFMIADSDGLSSTTSPGFKVTPGAGVLTISSTYPGNAGTSRLSINSILDVGISNVGIGTTTPTGFLDIHGDVDINSSNSTGIFNVYNTSNFNILSINGSSGFVGIGVEPTSPLEIKSFPVLSGSMSQNTQQIRSYITGSSSSTQRALYFANNIMENTSTIFNRVYGVSGEVYLGLNTSGFTNSPSNISEAIGVVGGVVSSTTNVSGRIVNAEGVRGTVQRGGGAILNASGFKVYLVQATGTDATATHNAFGILIGNGITATGGAVNNAWAIYSEATNPSYLKGNLGINTSSPQQTLTVVGTMNITRAVTMQGGLQCLSTYTVAIGGADADCTAGDYVYGVTALGAAIKCCDLTA